MAKKQRPYLGVGTYKRHRKSKLKYADLSDRELIKLVERGDPKAIKMAQKRVKNGRILNIPKPKKRVQTNPHGYSPGYPETQAPDYKARLLENNTPEKLAEVKPAKQAKHPSFYTG